MPNQVKRAFGFEVSRQRLGTVPFAANQRQELDVKRGIPTDYFLWGLALRLRYRVAVSGGTTNGTVVAEAGQNLIERMEISGNHKAFGDWTRVQLQGSHLYQYGNIMMGYVHERSLGGLSGAIGNYDIATTIIYPFVPSRIRPEEQLLYLLDPPLWNNLQLYIDWGGIGTPISGGDRTVAIQGFGGVGTPELIVTRLPAKLKGDRFKVQPIPVKHTYKPVDLVNSVADALVTDLNVGNFLPQLMMVTGVRATGASAAGKGDNFLTLSDAIYDPVKLKRDDIELRNVNWRVNQEIEASRKANPAAFPTGYNNFEFVEDYTVTTAFDTREIAQQKTRFELHGTVVGAANQKGHILFHELAGVPVFGEEAA